MGHSYIKFYAHLIFATNNRVPWFRESALRKELHHYLFGLAASYKIAPLAVGGWIEHVHMSVEIPKTRSLADCLRILKSSSSRWLRETKKPRLSEFAWQEGYSAFSVSESVREKVIDYIRRQEEHHGRTTYDYLAELRLLTERHGIEYTEESE